MEEEEEGVGTDEIPAMAATAEEVTHGGRVEDKSGGDDDEAESSSNGVGVGDCAAQRQGQQRRQPLPEST